MSEITYGIDPAVSEADVTIVSMERKFYHKLLDENTNLRELLASAKPYVEMWDCENRKTTDAHLWLIKYAKIVVRG